MSKLEKLYTKKDLEEAFKKAWKSCRTYQSGKEAFKEWFKDKYPREPIVFKVKDLNKYKPLDLEE
jgi:hypothetical protein